MLLECGGGGDQGQGKVQDVSTCLAPHVWLILDEKVPEKNAYEEPDKTQLKKIIKPRLGPGAAS